MTKYAVVDSFYLRKEIHPFGGCFEVIKETNKFVWVIVPGREGEIEERKIGLARVYFFTDRDVTNEIKDINEYVEENFRKHNRYIDKLISNLREKSVFQPAEKQA